MHKIAKDLVETLKLFLLLVTAVSTAIIAYRIDDIIDLLAVLVSKWLNSKIKKLAFYS